MRDKRENPKTKSKKTEEQKAARKRLTTRIITAVSITLALVYIVFVFVTTNFMGNDNIVTQTVYKASASDSISTTGFVIRNEEYIESSQKGVLVYDVSDGDKVKANGDIATVYNTDTDATNSKRISELDEMIADLTALNKVSNSANIGLDSVNNQISQRLISFISNVNQRNFNEIDSDESELMTSIYRKQIITGEMRNFNEKIAQLNEEKEALENSNPNSIGTVTTKNSGYFVSAVDGYEKTFSIDNLSQITYKDIVDVKPADKDISKYVGKVIIGVNWYIACPVTLDEATAIKHNDSNISIRLPYATSNSIPAKVISVNQFKDDEKAVVILECNNMSTSLSQIRNETVDIELNTYKGLKVNKLALHDDFVTKTVTDESGKKTTEKSKVQGVFVKHGSELIFKQVQIIYSGDDYVICEEKPDDGVLFNGDTISLYDEVVVEGDDLYDGKLIK